MNTLYNKEPSQAPSCARPRKFSAPPAVIRAVLDHLRETGCPCCGKPVRDGHPNSRYRSLKAHCWFSVEYGEDWLRLTNRCPKHGWCDATEQRLGLLIQMYRRQPGRAAS